MADDEVKEIFPLKIFNNGLPVDADFRPTTVNSVAEDMIEVTQVFEEVAVDADDDVVTITETVIEVPVTDIAKSETHKVAAKD